MAREAQRGAPGGHALGADEQQVALVAVQRPARLERAVGDEGDAHLAFSSLHARVAEAVPHPRRHQHGEDRVGRVHADRRGERAHAGEWRAGRAPGARGPGGPWPAPGRADACRSAQSLPPPGTEITKVIVYINNTYAYNCTVHRTQTNYKA